LCEAEKETARLKKEPRKIEAAITGNDEGTRSGGKETPIAGFSITRWGLWRYGLREGEKEPRQFKKEPRQKEATISGNHEGTKP